MKDPSNNSIILDPEDQLWEKVFTVAPLVLVGTREGEHLDLAPKHMAMPLGPGPYFGFVCTPTHATYQNILDNEEFTVSFPKPSQIIMSSLTASPRCEEQGQKTIIDRLQTYRGNKVDAPVLQDAYLILECDLMQIIDGFDTYSLICGRIVQASVDPDHLKRSEIDPNEQIYTHPYLAYLAHGRWSSIRETYSFPYPKDFRK